MNLWSEANWRGIGFMRGGGLKYPVMGMVFTNASAGKKIFEGWKKRYGEADIDDVRMSIIRGIDKNNLYSYRTHICADRRTYANNDGKMFYLPSRTLDMVPTSQQHLNDFLFGYTQFNSILNALNVGIAQQSLLSGDLLIPRISDIVFSEGHGEEKK